jgi:hypothetical protein
MLEFRTPNKVFFGVVMSIEATTGKHWQEFLMRYSWEWPLVVAVGLDFRNVYNF